MVELSPDNRAEAESSAAGHRVRAAGAALAEPVFVWGVWVFAMMVAVLYVYRYGVDLPHYSGSQFLLGTRVAPADLKPGDVVFFGSPIHHVGIYVGAGYFIHAPRTGDFVKVSPLAERTDFAGARRYDWQPRLDPPLGVESVTTEPDTTEGE